jgi:hypothetical protein
MFYDIYDIYRKYGKNVYVVVNVQNARVCGFIVIKKCTFQFVLELLYSHGYIIQSCTTHRRRKIVKSLTEKSLALANCEFITVAYFV